MKRSHRIVYTLLGLIVAAPILAACHTTEGAGEDISATGHAITHGAEHSTP